MDAVILARSLGWFSLGIGLTELVAGKSLNRWLGVRGPPELTRAFGLREIGVGIGLLTASRLAPWMWARAAGDVLDVATLGAALGAGNERRGRASVALVAVAGITLLDLLCARELSRRPL
ncbi:MAG TPA: hypothetical protein VJ779_09740 [Acetobacteraceae bacterium]|jgi:hypothetical protein|nr:hypothetical protein [Acetobacteraceae bacterium]